MKTLQVADLFCGAGGTSSGAIDAIERLGMTTRLTAINHWDIAVATHTANHPDASHLCESLDNLNPRHLFDEGDLDLLWASPECIHHSRARGGKPINDQNRATAWCVVRWAEALRPPIILVENVVEFRDWGGIGSNGRPLKSKKGETYRAWIAALESLGYRVGEQVLCAADFGDPTTRRRLFIQAVRGKRRIMWPNPTHAPSGAELFDRQPYRTARSIIDWDLEGQSIFARKRPLSIKTIRRIEAGLIKYGLASFIVPQNRGGRPVHDTEEPLATVTGTSRGVGLAQPYLVKLRNNSTAVSVDDPLGTVTAGGGHHGLCQPFLLQVNHGGGIERRTRSADAPIPTVCGTRGEWAVAEPFLLSIDNQSDPNGVRSKDEPLSTITTKARHAVVQPFLIEYYGKSKSQSVENPLSVVTTKERHGLVQPVIKVDGANYLLDIRFRMLQPHELAAAQGFPDDYEFTGNKTQIVKQIGNAVPCGLARAIVLAAVSQQNDISSFLPPPKIAAA